MESLIGMGRNQPEVSAPRKKRANRKIPDVAKRLGIKSLDVFQLTRKLDFRTDWQSGRG